MLFIFPSSSCPVTANPHEMLFPSVCCHHALQTSEKRRISRMMTHCEGECIVQVCTASGIKEDYVWKMGSTCRDRERAISRGIIIMITKHNYTAPALPRTPFFQSLIMSTWDYENNEQCGWGSQSRNFWHLSVRSVVLCTSTPISVLWRTVTVKLFNPSNLSISI